MSRTLLKGSQSADLVDKLKFSLYANQSRGHAQRHIHTHIHKGGFSQLKCSKETTGSGSEACFCTIEEKQKAPVNRFVFFLSSFFPFYHLRSFTLLSDRYVCIVYSKGQDRLNNNNKKAVQQRHRVRPVGKWERRLQESIF